MTTKPFKEKWEQTMGTFLSERELSQLTAPDNSAFPSPVPLQMVSNGEFNPLPQSEQQRKVEGRLKDLTDQHGHSSVGTVAGSCAPLAAWQPRSWR
jgi:hypothetical protein